MARHPPRAGRRRCRRLWRAEYGRRPRERCRRLRAVVHGSRRRYGTSSCDMNTKHGFRRLNRRFAAVRTPFADVDHAVVADDAELATAAAVGV